MSHIIIKGKEIVRYMFISTRTSCIVIVFHNINEVYKLLHTNYNDSTRYSGSINSSGNNIHQAATVAELPKIGPRQDVRTMIFTHWISLAVLEASRIHRTPKASKYILTSPQLLILDCNIHSRQVVIITH